MSNPEQLSPGDFGQHFPTNSDQSVFPISDSAILNPLILCNRYNGWQSRPSQPRFSTKEGINAGISIVATQL